MAKKKKKPRKFNENSAIRSAIRRIFSRSPLVIEVMKDARREREWLKKDGTPAVKPRVEYLCAKCNKWFMGKNIQVDHREPVIELQGFVDWNTFVARLFCDKSNLHVLCKECHHTKTQEEAAARRAFKKSQKV